MDGKRSKLVQSHSFRPVLFKKDPRTASFVVLIGSFLLQLTVVGTPDIRTVFLPVLESYLPRPFAFPVKGKEETSHKHSHRNGCDECECASKGWRGQTREGRTFAQWSYSTILVFLTDTFTGKFLCGRDVGGGHSFGNDVSVLGCKLIAI